jgi:branched-subunit amino acid ABC-type transport system permease component
VFAVQEMGGGFWLGLLAAPMVLALFGGVSGLTFLLFYRTRFGLAARGVIANRMMAASLWH